MIIIVIHKLLFLFFFFLLLLFFFLLLLYTNLGSLPARPDARGSAPAKRVLSETGTPSSQLLYIYICIVISCMSVYVYIYIYIYIYIARIHYPRFAPRVGLRFKEVRTLSALRISKGRVRKDPNLGLRTGCTLRFIFLQTTKETNGF